MAAERQRIAAKAMLLREVAQEGQPDACGAEAAVYEDEGLGPQWKVCGWRGDEDLEAALRGGDGVAGGVGREFGEGFWAGGPAERVPVCHLQCVLISARRRC